MGVYILGIYLSYCHTPSPIHSITDHLRYHIVTTTVRLSTIRNIVHFCRIVATTIVLTI